LNFGSGLFLLVNMKPQAGIPNHKPLVDFLIVGAQKSGTSALDHYLRQHPDLVFNSVRKEAHFFDTDNIFNKPEVNYRNYHQLFGDQDPQKLWGECTPNYMYWHDALPRIYAYNPDIRLLAVLRNPVERAYSAWNMERDRGNESLGFRQAIEQEASRCRSSLPAQHRVYAYVDRGYYSEQIRRIWRYYTRQQTLFIRYESLKQDPQSCLDQVTDFLGVKPMQLQQAEAINSVPYPETMRPEDRQLLTRLYRPEITQLEAMLGWDCADWLTQDDHSS
jgi:hypothetical protein